MFELQPGDTVPNYVLEDVVGQPNGPVIDSRGRPMILVFCTDEFDRNLAPFAAAASTLKETFDLSIITPLPREENRAIARRHNLPWGVLAERQGGRHPASHVRRGRTQRPGPDHLCARPGSSCSAG